MREHDHRYVMVPALPVATLIVIQAEFFFELVIVLLDLPAALDQPHDPPQRGAGREIAQPVLGGRTRRLGPLGQLPDLLARRSAVLIPMAGLYPRRPEA